MIPFLRSGPRPGPCPRDIALEAGFRDNTRRDRIAHWLNVTVWLLLFGGSLDLIPAEMCRTAPLLLGLALHLRSRNVFRAAPVTILFTSFIVLLFALVHRAGGLEAIDRLNDLGDQSLWGLQAGEIWRVVSSSLLHDDWKHATNNAPWMLALGFVVEPAIGSKRLIQAFGFIAIVSAIPEAAFHSAVIGASDLGFGLHGLLLARPFRVGEFGRRTLDMAWVLNTWLLVRYMPDSLLAPQVSVAGHAAGLVAGVLLSAIWQWRATGLAKRAMIPAPVGVALALALVCAFAANYPWVMGWHRRAASTAERHGEYDVAERSWKRVEDLADPTSDVGAQALMCAADFWNDTGRSAEARRIAESVASMLGPDGYAFLAELQSTRAPYQEGRALESLRAGLALDPLRSTDLRTMADISLFPDDSTLYSPERARAYAWCAVQLDGRDHESLRALATAYARLGRMEDSTRWFRLAAEHESGPSWPW